MIDRAALRRRLATVAVLTVALLVVTAAPAAAAHTDRGFDSFEDGDPDGWEPQPKNDGAQPAMGITQQGPTDGQYALTIANDSLGYLEWTEFMRDEPGGAFYNISLNATVNVTRGGTTDTGGLTVSSGPSLSADEKLGPSHGAVVFPANNTLVVRTYESFGGIIAKQSLGFSVQTNESYRVTYHYDGADHNASITDTNGNQYWANGSDSSQSAHIADAGVIGTNATFDEFNYTVYLAHEPIINESSAAPTETKASPQSQLSIDINDSDFPTSSDQVTVEFFHKGPGDSDFSSLGTDSRSSNGTVSLSQTFGVGEHEWYVNATDGFGHVNESSTFSFGVQGYLKVYNEDDPDQLIDDRTVNATFYGSEGHVEINETDTGIVSMQGLPANQSYVVRLKAKQDTTRQLFIPDTTTNRTAFLQDRTGGVVYNVTFELQDRTSRFSPDESVLIIQRPINQSNTLKYRTLVSDEFGAASQVEAELVGSQRYRLIIENRDGDRRILGPYHVTQDEVVPIQVGGLRYSRAGGESYNWDASHLPESNGPDVTFNYTDPDEETSRLRVIITNRSSGTVIHDQTYRDVSSLSVRKDRGADDSASYNVTFLGKRDGEDVGATLIVGPRREPGIPLDSMWQQTFAVGMVIVVAGGFAGFGDPGLAAVAAALVGGVMWFIGWLPAAVGGGVIALAIAVGAMWLARGGEA